MNERLVDFKDLQFNHRTVSFVDKIAEYITKDPTTVDEESKEIQNPKLPTKINDRDLYTHTTPTPLSKPVLLVSSPKAALLLGVEPSSLEFSQNLDFLNVSQFQPNSSNIAFNYGGYQNGIYNLLGDGRTMTVGEVTNASKYILQYKGVGPTPYAQNQDGLMKLSTCLYDFFISETLAQLNIPTARSLTVIGSSSVCYRGQTEEKMYTTGIISKYARTWIRFGTFEYLYFRGDTSGLKSLADYVIQEFYPDSISLEFGESITTNKLISGDFFDKNQDILDGGILAPEKDIADKLETVGTPLKIPLNRYGILFRRIVEKTAILVAHWQAVGYVHGCLNTENFSVIGDTIHFESGGFMDSYDPEWTPNKKDAKGKYSFEKQPEMAKWALSRLGQTLAIFIGDTYTTSPVRPYTRGSNDPPRKENRPTTTPSIPTQRKLPLGFLFDASKSENIVRELLKEFDSKFLTTYGEIMCNKLGIKHFESSDYDQIINPMLELLAATGVDYTAFFRSISSFGCGETKYSQEISYLPGGVHSEEALLSTEPANTLALLLRSLAVLKKEDAEYVAAETERINRESFVVPTSPAKENNSSQLPSIAEDEPEGPEAEPAAIPQIQVPKPPGIEPLPLPSLDEVASQWKFWAHMYRTRLIAQLSNERKSAQALMEEDHARQRKLKNINPRYVMRGYMLRDTISAVNKLMPPVIFNRRASMQAKQGNTKAKRRGKKDDEVADKIDTSQVNIQTNSFKEVQKLLKIIVNDVYGEIAESRSGWKTDEDKQFAQTWSVTPSTVNSNLKFNNEGE
ncbi:hypothetical protein HDV06_000699 [Boothiomyces sp. JEL0866]|nr:hypothetical protein HDV06_000699 [Boothiomyces sp. JEL0866]